MMINQEKALLVSQRVKQELLDKEFAKLSGIIDSELKRSIAKGQDYTEICIDNYSNEVIHNIKILLISYKYRIKIKQTYTSVSGMRLPHTKYLMIGWNVSWWEWLWL